MSGIPAHLDCCVRVLPVLKFAITAMTNYRTANAVAKNFPTFYATAIQTYSFGVYLQSHRNGEG